MAAAGGAGSPISVTTTAGCAWSAVANASWLTITSGATGSATGSVGFRADPNSGAQRSGTLTIAGQTVTVTQAAVVAPCTYQVAPLEQSMAAAGGAGTPIGVMAGAGCAWTASSAVAWITITSETTRTGNGSVAFTVAANPGSEREGTLTIAGKTVTVSQSAAEASCTFTISPTSDSIGLKGGPGKDIMVRGPSKCSWTATSNVSWLTITAGASETGNGKVEYIVGALAAGSRVGTLTIAGQTFTVTQSGSVP